ncbi:MAG: metallophosphoesterase [Pirellulales bacterium]
MHLAILILGALGHVILWVGLVNRAHGLGIQRRWVNALSVLCCILFAGVPIAAAVAIGTQWTFPPVGVAPAIAWDYLAVCSIVCVVAAIQRWRWYCHPERRGALFSNHTSQINLAEDIAGPLTAPGIPRWLSRLPGNEALTIRVQEKHLAIPRLTSAYGGLRIVHISDLHMSGRISKAYFERVVDEVNRCQPDLIAITGDLVEREACLDWVPSTFGRLQARDGVFYVLGNHDRHVRKDRLTAALTDAGLFHLGGTWRRVTIRHTPVILAGNELPWYGPAADFRDCPTRDSRGLPLRIVLAHSPDRFGWARENDVDLLLAGHNHGGQVCLPLLGPIVAPSLQGVRYASGAFRADNTVLHVSRGTSSLTPLRWNCPPEIAVLNLRPSADDQSRFSAFG